MFSWTRRRSCQVSETNESRRIILSNSVHTSRIILLFLFLSAEAEGCFYHLCSHLNTNGRTKRTPSGGNQRVDSTILWFRLLRLRKSPSDSKLLEVSVFLLKLSVCVLLMGDINTERLIILLKHWKALKRVSFFFPSSPPDELSSV